MDEAPIIIINKSVSSFAIKEFTIKKKDAHSKLDVLVEQKFGILKSDQNFSLVEDDIMSHSAFIKNTNIFDKKITKIYVYDTKINIILDNMEKIANTIKYIKCDDKFEMRRMIISIKLGEICRELKNLCQL